MSARSAKHGGVTAAERKLVERGLERGMDLVDLSINLNPFGAPANVVAAIRHCEINSYPDSKSTELRKAFGERLHLSSDQIVFGNGATELLWGLARLFASASASALVVEPTFSEYARAAEACGAKVFSYWGHREYHYSVTPDEIALEAHRLRVQSVYLCRPNNPTGGGMPFAELKELAEALGSVRLILDESFLSLSRMAAEANLELPDNVIRVRSLTKDFAMPGLRLGYLVTTATLAASLEANRPPWTTSSIAQAAGMAILESGESLSAARKELLAASDQLCSGLSKFELETLPTSTIFALVDVGGGAAFRSRLLRSGVVVRDTASFGLPQHVRIAAGNSATQARLWAAIERALDEGSPTP